MYASKRGRVNFSRKVFAATDIVSEMTDMTFSHDLSWPLLIDLSLIYGILIFLSWSQRSKTNLNRGTKLGDLQENSTLL